MNALMPTLNRNTIRVLLIEDDPEDAAITQTFLRRSDEIHCEVKWVSNLHEYRQLAHADETFEVILMDYFLGAQATAKDLLSELPPSLSSAAVVVLTGRDITEVDEAAFGMGVEFFLSKLDIKPELLLRTIRYAIRNKDLHTRLSNFASIVAHDLKGPAGNIRNFISLIEEGLGNQLDTEFPQMMGLVQEECDKLNTLISELQAYSMSRNGSLNCVRCDLGQLIGEIISSLDRNETKARATVEVDRLPTVNADRNLLFHLFLNLVQNGLKYNRSSHPRVVVSGETLEGFALIQVSDNGIGIPPEYHKRIFQPMTRVHQNSEFKGTGLGLAICKEAIERHGGLIWVDSSGIEGEGSTFFIQLPLRDLESENQAAL